MASCASFLIVLIGSIYIRFQVPTISQTKLKMVVFELAALYIKTAAF
jgi:hypothetical protein